MIDVDKIISELPNADLEKRAKLLQALLELLPKPDTTESLEDFVSIDMPLDSHKDEKTGKLQIRFAYQVGWNNPRLAWRLMDVTPDAQIALVSIFLESIDSDKKAGRTQPKLATIQ